MAWKAAARTPLVPCRPPARWGPQTELLAPGFCRAQPCPSCRSHLASDPVHVRCLPFCLSSLSRVPGMQEARMSPGWHCHCSENSSSALPDKAQGSFRSKCTGSGVMARHGGPHPKRSCRDETRAAADDEGWEGERPGWPWHRYFITAKEGMGCRHHRVTPSMATSTSEVFKRAKPCF